MIVAHEIVLHLGPEGMWRTEGQPSLRPFPHGNGPRIPLTRPSPCDISRMSHCGGGAPRCGLGILVWLSRQRERL